MFVRVFIIAEHLFGVKHFLKNFLKFYFLLNSAKKCSIIAIVCGGEKMAQYSYNPKGVCSVKINFEIEDGIVKNVQFERGCSGNTQGVAKLAEGMPAEEIVKRLKGTDCASRGTSCPDQLARAIELALIEENK